MLFDTFFALTGGLPRRFAPRNDTKNGTINPNFTYYISFTKKVKVSIFQVILQIFSGPGQGAADGASMYATVSCNIADPLLPIVVIQQDIPLCRCQNFFNHCLQPLQLHLPGKLVGKRDIKGCIFHFCSTPCRSSGRSVPPVRSFGSAEVSARQCVA